MTAMIAGEDVEYWEARFISEQGYGKRLKSNIKQLERRNEILSGRIYALIGVILIIFAIMVAFS